MWRVAASQNGCCSKYSLMSDHILFTIWNTPSRWIKLQKYCVSLGLVRSAPILRPRYQNTWESPIFIVAFLFEWSCRCLALVRSFTGTEGPFSAWRKTFCPGKESPTAHVVIRSKYIIIVDDIMGNYDICIPSHVVVPFEESYFSLNKYIFILEKFSLQDTCKPHFCRQTFKLNCFLHNTRLIHFRWTLGLIKITTI